MNYCLTIPPDIPYFCRELAQASAEICDPNELLSICLEFVPAPAVARPDEVGLPVVSFPLIHLILTFLGSDVTESVYVNSGF